MRIKHTIQSPDFFDIDSIFDKNITNRNKQIELYLAVSEIILVSIKKRIPHINTEQYDRLAPAISSQEYKYFDQHFLSVKNETTV